MPHILANVFVFLDDMFGDLEPEPLLSVLTSQSGVCHLSSQVHHIHLGDMTTTKENKCKTLNVFFLEYKEVMK